MANTTNTTGNLPSGFWQGLWENADEGVDALGRNTYSMTTAFGNMITAWIQAGKGEYPNIVVEDDRPKYYAIIAVVIAVAVVLIFILK